MHMADRLEALARDVNTFAEEDADLARQMARDVRADHLAAQVETARLEEVEARVEEAERRRRAEVEARREIERREERETQARLAEDARLAAGIQASPSDASTRDASEGPGIAFLAKRERARARAQNLPTLFDLDAMPDEVAGCVLRQMGAYELAATSCVNKRFRQLARTDDALWRRLQLTAGRHPRWRVDGSWREAFFQGAGKIDANWRRGKFRRLEHRLHSEYTGAVSMAGDLACSGSADHDLAIFGLPPRARGTPLQGVGLLWERQLGRCVGHSEPVTCVKLVGGDRSGSEDGKFSPPTLAVSGTARGEMRVWSLSSMPTCPWDAEDDETWGDMATPGGVHDTTTPIRVPCVETRLLTTPETGQPHAQFFDVSARGRSGDGGFGSVATAGAEHGAGVHVYDSNRWGAAVVRVPGFDAGVYGVSWGRGGQGYDEHVVHAACSDGIVRRWDVRAPGQGARLDSASVGESTGRNRRVARCVDADGGLFAFGSAAGAVAVHDARVPGTPLATPRRVHSDCVNAVAIDARLGRVVSGGDDCQVAIQRLPLTLEDAQVASAQTPQGVLGVAFDHSRLVIGCEDSTVRVFDAELGEGFVDGEALKQAMRELNRRTQGAGSILHRQRRERDGR